MPAFVVLRLVSSVTVSGWLGRESVKLPILCQMVCETLVQSYDTIR